MSCFLGLKLNKLLLALKHFGNTFDILATNFALYLITPFTFFFSFVYPSYSNCLFLF